MRFLFICLLLTVTAGLQAQKNTVIIAKVNGLEKDTAAWGIRGFDRSVYPMIEIAQIAKPGNDHTVRFEFELTKPQELLFYTTKTRAAVFMEPGDILDLSYDAKNPDSTMVFSGGGAKNSAALNKMNQIFATDWNKLDSTTTPTSFTAFYNNVYAKQLTFLQENRKSLSPYFYTYIQAGIYAYKYSGLLGVPTLLQMVKQKKKSDWLPAGYWANINQIKLDTKWLINPEYVKVLNYSYPALLLDKSCMDKGVYDTPLERSDKLVRIYEIQREAYKKYPEILAKTLPYAMDNVLENAPDVTKRKYLLDDYLENYCKNDIERDALKALYSRLAAVGIGKVPPPFTLKDLNGKDVSLTDFKGKVIYIDFWASWCTPCRAQMKEAAPALHKKFEDNKEVVFLYISIDDNANAWRKAISDDKINGIHLLSDNGAKGRVAQLFGINGVPRYMIIDKQGKIFDNDAPRPSESKTEEKIKEALRAS